MKDSGNIPNYCGDCGRAQGTMFAKDGYVLSNRFCLGCGAEIGEKPRALIWAQIVDLAVVACEWAAVGFFIITCIVMLISWLQ